jgi:hypothetical protein
MPRADDGSPLLTRRELGNGLGSIVQVTRIEPDMLEMNASLQSNVNVVYWVESDGPLLSYFDDHANCQTPQAVCSAPHPARPARR